MKWNGMDLVEGRWGWINDVMLADGRPAEEVRCSFVPLLGVFKSARLVVRGTL